MENHSEILKLVEVARMYYEKELNQSEIAKMLGVSRPLVSKMLQRCKELGIVNIEIKSPLEGNEGLLNKMKMKFDLLDGLIVPANRNNLNLSMKNFISQASIFLERRLSDQVSIGLGWGGVLADIVDVFSAEELNTEKAINVCPLIGSMSSPSKGFHPNELSRRFAKKIEGEALYLHAPAFPGSQKNFEVFQQTDEYKSISAVWQNLDTAIVSIGNYPSIPDQATAIRFGKTLKEKHAVGMLLSNFYDVNGNIIEGENDYVIRIPLDYLRKVNKVILVCSGNLRANSILGALKTGLITHIVTDDFAAKNVLELVSDLSE